MLEDNILRTNWKILSIIIIITVVILVSIWIAIITPPSKTLTICDKSHSERYTYMVPVKIGDMTTMQTRVGTKTVCDESHIEPNPEYAKWIREHPDG